MTTPATNDITAPQTLEELRFWDAAFTAALHRVDASEASRQASFALLKHREMSEAITSRFNIRVEAFNRRE